MGGIDSITNLAPWRGIGGITHLALWGYLKSSGLSKSGPSGGIFRKAK